MGVFINEIGNRHGRLVVIECAGTEKNRGKRYRWKCRCDCGNIVVVVGPHLRGGNTKSCGCIAREHGKEQAEKNRKPVGEANFNLMYSSYKISAKKRGLQFELSKKDFRSIVQNNCFYCGCEQKPIERKKGLNGLFYGNGVDRVDNSKGYVIDNCVPCCSTCNSMKNDLHVDMFIKHIERIYLWQHFRP